MKNLTQKEAKKLGTELRKLDGSPNKKDQLRIKSIESIFQKFGIIDEEGCLIDPTPKNEKLCKIVNDCFIDVVGPFIKKVDTKKATSKKVTAKKANKIGVDLDKVLEIVKTKKVDTKKVDTKKVDTKKVTSKKVDTKKIVSMAVFVDQLIEKGLDLVKVHLAAKKESEKRGVKTYIKKSTINIHVNYRINVLKKPWTLKNNKVTINTKK